MKYRNLTDLAKASGFSRYQVIRAIEAQVIKPEWLWVSQAGHRKVRIEHWGQCLEALEREWGKSGPAYFRSDRAKREGAACAVAQSLAPNAGDDAPGELAHGQVLRGEGVVSEEETARVTGLAVDEIRRALDDGMIPARCTGVEPPISIGARYGAVVNDIVRQVHTGLLGSETEWPLEVAVAALFQLGLILGADLGDLERRRVCGVLSNAAANGALEGWARFDIPCDFIVKPAPPEAATAQPSATGAR